MTFEQALERLDAIVSRLSDGNTPLEESLTLFGEGSKLIGQCEAELKNAHLTIEQLMPKDGNEDGVQ
ncbi:MAG: exodeoxyribonuclease VII small subunit [Oscillospiraceae bacterium]